MYGLTTTDRREQSKGDSSSRRLEFFENIFYTAILARETIQRETSPNISSKGNHPGTKEVNTTRLDEDTFHLRIMGGLPLQ